MNRSSEPIARLIYELSRLPGIGRKSAQRLTYYLLDADSDQVRRLAEAIVEATENTKRCSQCLNYTDTDPCSICSNGRRDRTVICVVEQPKDLLAMEKTGRFHGLYHVLHGSIDISKGRMPEDLPIPQLLRRVGEEGVKEVIVATNPTATGESTALYIAEQLRPVSVKVTRISYGIPVGGDLEYYDDLTISAALEHRVEMK